MLAEPASDTSRAVHHLGDAVVVEVGQRGRQVAGRDLLEQVVDAGLRASWSSLAVSRDWSVSTSSTEPAAARAR